MTSQARLDDFEADVGLVDNQFNVAVSILNVGYMLAQLPSNMILTRVRPSIYLPCCVLVWSCISAATAGVTSFGGLIAVRFFLGIVEAPFFPGVCICPRLKGSHENDLADNEQFRRPFSCSLLGTHAKSLPFAPQSFTPASCLQQHFLA